MQCIKKFKDDGLGVAPVIIIIVIFFSSFINMMLDISKRLIKMARDYTFTGKVGFVM